MHVLHETVGRFGTVDWLYPRPQRKFRFQTILHQVRAPLVTIESLHSCGEDAWKRVRKVVPFITGSVLSRAMLFWHYWNIQCEELAAWSYRVEDMDTVFLRILSEVGAEQYRKKYRKISTTTNTRRRTHALPSLTWADLRAENAELTQRILDLSHHYGY